MRQVQVLGRLHFDEPAYRTLELETQAFTRVQRVRRPFCRYDELDVAVVKFVDEGDEAACLVFAELIKLRNAGQDDCGVPARDLDVVCLAARPVTQLGEIEPGDTFGSSVGFQRTAVDLEFAVFLDLAGGRFTE